MNQLILGDCLEVLKQMDSESVDLVYLDPPFFSNRNYEVIWGDKGEIRSFEDRWSGGVEHYIGWLKERVQEMHRILKPTGSIYLHCDWHADAYIRVFILDKIFGEGNFRNHIIWKRNFTKKGSQYKMSRLANNSDTIFLYTKSNKYFFITPKIKEINEAVIAKYDKVDEKGRRYKSEPIELPKMMARKNLIYEYKGYTPTYGWMVNYDKLVEMDKKEKLIFTKNGKPRRKNFLEDFEGIDLDNIWTDLLPIGQVQSEIIGYPTQKPEKLLERIILASSNEGDTVLDPFVGGGTTVAVADRLKRKWIGIDQSVAAVKVSEMRLNNQQDLFSEPFTVTLHKYDYDTLRNKNAFEFETWIINQFGMKFGIGVIPQNKKGGDGGFDGKTRSGTPIQVKRSDNISINVIKNFFSSCIINDKAGTEARKAAGEPIGYIIAFSFGSGAVQETAKLKLQENVIIKLVRVDEIVRIAHRPKLSVKIEEIKDVNSDDSTAKAKTNTREIEFTATAESESGIEMYSWDFDFNENEPFKAEVLIDRTGKQSFKFKPGQHTIAVKAVDTEGLEAVEIIRIKVNGEVVVE